MLGKPPTENLEERLAGVSISAAMGWARKVLSQFANPKHERHCEMRELLCGRLIVDEAGHLGTEGGWLHLLPPEGTEETPEEAGAWGERVVHAADDHPLLWRLCRDVLRRWRVNGDYPVPEIMKEWWLDQVAAGTSSDKIKPPALTGRPRNKHRDEQIRCLAIRLHQAGVATRTAIAERLSAAANDGGLKLSQDSVLKILQSETTLP